MIYHVRKKLTRGWEIVKEDGTRICSVATKRSAIELANEYAKGNHSGYVVHDQPKV